MAKQKKEKTENEDTEQKVAKKPNWFKISIIANIVLVVGIVLALVGVEIIHQSDTNPQLCATCHLMQSHVDSYLGSPYLDNLHEQANVECKDCHDYPIPAEISSGIRYLTGNYEVDENGDLLKVKYDDDMCLQCHISYDHLGESTSFLERNPHDHHSGELACRTCHTSHGPQIDYCSQCHDNGGQRILGSEG